MQDTMKQLCQELEGQLIHNILPFWMEHTVDERYGGFAGEVSSDGTMREKADKGLVLHARILWTFSSACRITGDVTYAAYMERAYAYLTAHFTDSQQGGMLWLLACDGSPKEDQKQVHGQAFAIYGLAEYVRATGSKTALEQAKALYRLLEKHAYDEAYGGYMERYDRDWCQAHGIELGEGNRLASKSMNTQLHMLEAYTCLLRVWEDSGLRRKLAELIEITLSHIVNRSTGHFHRFFHRNWQPLSTAISFGHDIEGSWLLWEAARVLGDEKLLARTRPVCIQLAAAVYEEALQPDGSLWYERDGEHIAKHKEWWLQAEAIVGFMNAYELTRESRYLHAALRSWTYTKDNMIDHELGEWHWKVDEQGNVDRTLPKAGVWKCPYHNGRACMELMERVKVSEGRTP
ncbi:AGE family epimerase/isomerase [Paenibacillus sp. F411]|uniref:AGE family epimerase/isomerase n=1 Tax=Paenibacillus sp. F411 TaxID=2820239 RepID=UPI001AAF8AB8|nr:AGE family epimerase/isomerase [Paenibacillus sp. F411]MBO2944389.1 AGE family epimerase/isomerase [Paenibacillus sp. F411]